MTKEQKETKIESELTIRELICENCELFKHEIIGILDEHYIVYRCQSCGKIMHIDLKDPSFFTEVENVIRVGRIGVDD